MKLETQNSTLKTENSEPTEHSTIKSWPRLYSMLLAELVLLIVLFYIFMKSFS